MYNVNISKNIGQPFLKMTDNIWLHVYFKVNAIAVTDEVKISEGMCRFKDSFNNNVFILKTTENTNPRG